MRIFGSTFCFITNCIDLPPNLEFSACVPSSCILPSNIKNMNSLILIHVLHNQWAQKLRANEQSKSTKCADLKRLYEAVITWCKQLLWLTMGCSFGVFVVDVIASLPPPPPEASPHWTAERQRRDFNSYKLYYGCTMCIIAQILWRAFWASAPKGDEVL